jgi:hypothetical protein
VAYTFQPIAFGLFMLITMLTLGIISIPLSFIVTFGVSMPQKK